MKRLCKRAASWPAGEPFSEARPSTLIEDARQSAAASEAGGLGQLRAIAKDEEEGNVYLREMRDVLQWMQAQMGGGAAPGGAFRPGFAAGARCHN